MAMNYDTIVGQDTLYMEDSLWASSIDPLDDEYPIGVTIAIGALLFAGAVVVSLALIPAHVAGKNDVPRSTTTTTTESTVPTDILSSTTESTIPTDIISTTAGAASKIRRNREATKISTFRPLVTYHDLSEVDDVM